MANIIVSTTALGINVSETVSNISVTDTESNVIVTNVASSVANVTVSSTDTTVNVSQTASISNASVRTKLGVENVSGYGNLAYDSTDASNGIFQYTGVSNADIITVIDDNPANVTQHLSVTDTGGDGSLSYANATGVFTYTGPSATEVRAHISSADAGGDGSMGYDPNSGIITYQGPDQAEANARIAAAPLEVRSHISGVSPITYNASTGAIGLEQTLDDLTLKKYQETIVDSGNVSGTAVFNITDGTVHTANITGNITNISLTNISAGGSATLFLKQDSTGGYALDTDSFSGTWKFVNEQTALDTNPSNTSIVSVFYDGSVYTATVVDYLAKATEAITVNGTTIQLGGSGNITVQPVDISIPANVLLTGTQDDNGGQIIFSRDAWGTGYDHAHISKTGTNNDLKITSQAGYNLILDDTATSPTASRSFKIDRYGFGSINPLFEVQPTGNVKIDLNPTGPLTSTAKFTIGHYLHGGAASTNEIFEVDMSGNVTATGNIETNSHIITDQITPLTNSNVNINGNLDITGNLEVTGNINYREVTDLLVQDQTITLNYGNASAQDAQIIVDRSGSTLSNVDLKWNETADKWQFSNDGSTYNNMLTVADIPASGVTSVNGDTGPAVTLDTDDIAEGTAKYYATSLFNTDFATKTTTDLTEGTNLYYTQSRVRGDVDGETASATGTGSLVYDSATGMFTYTPPNLSNKIELTSLSTTTASASGGGSLAYNNSTGVFTFAPAVTQTDAEVRALLSTTSGTASGGGSLAYDSATGVFTYAPSIPGIQLSALSTATAAASAGGSLAYDSGTGVFTFAPADLSTKIALTDLSVTTATASGDGALAYDNTSGIFTFTPADSGASDYGDSNVVSLLNAFGSNTITTTGNISTGIFNGDSINSTAGFTINSGNGTTITSKFGEANTVTETANISGKGYGIFNMTNSFDTTITYTGGDLDWFEIDGSTVAGSTTLTISSVVLGKDSTTGSLTDLNIGQVFENGSLVLFPIDAYITAIQSGSGTVTMSQPAINTATFTYASHATILDAGLVDTTTGLVITLYSDARNGGGSTSALSQRIIRNNPFGYPATGPEADDFDIITAGTASDYAVGSYSAYTMAQTSITDSKTALNAPMGITIGENTQLTNRGENDQFRSFGMNMLYDGKQAIAPGAQIQPQVLFKSYTDQTVYSSQPGSSGPRLFFSSALGNVDSNPYTTYPRTNQELGRLSFWGSTGTLLNPSSYSVPAYMSVHAADDWDTWTGGVGGNTNVYMGATSNGNTTDTYLAYKKGDLLLGSANSKPVTIAPAYGQNGTTPEQAYTGNYPTWANVNYANTGAASGAKLQVTNGGSQGIGIVGDMELSVHRNDVTGGGSNTSVTNSYTFGSNYYNNLQLGGFPDKSAFIFGNTGGSDIDLAGLTSGDQVTFNNYTGALGTEVNGNSYYVLVRPYAYTGFSPGTFYAQYLIALYTDATLSTPLQLTTSSGAYGTAGTMEWFVAPSVTDREFKFQLPEQSDNLILKNNNADVVFFNDKLNIGDSSDASVNYSLPSTAGTTDQILKLDTNNDLQWADESSLSDAQFLSLLRKYIGTINFVDGGLGNIDGGLASTTTFAINIDGGNA